MRSRHIRVNCADCGKEIYKYTRLTNDELKRRHITCPECWSKLKKETAKFRKIIKKLCPELRVQVYTWQLRSRFYVPPFPEAYTYILAPKTHKYGSRRTFTEQERKALWSMLGIGIGGRSVYCYVSREHRNQLIGSRPVCQNQLNFVQGLITRLYQEIGALFVVTKIPPVERLQKMSTAQTSNLVKRISSELAPAITD